jgi:signal transduction histidine kinase
MDEQQTGRRRDDLRNVAIASILEVTSDFLYVEDIDKLLQKIVKTVSETFGLQSATIGIRDRETGLFGVRATYGYAPEVDERIRKVKYTAERMTRDLKPEFKVGRNTYYVPGEAYELEGEEDMLFVLHPERLDRARRFPDEWHERDYIDLLMHERDGSLLGYLEIDEPDNHKVPDDDTLRAIEVFSDLAAIAIQNAELYSEVQEDRKKIELLIDLIGHDVNNYAQAVSGFVELAMARKGVPEPSRKSLAKALDQVWNLNKLVTNVKLFARVETAGGKDLQPMDIVGVVKDAFATAESCSPSKESELVLVNDDGKPKMSMMNDLAKDVFLNLFTNAIKFDAHEKVVVDVSIAEQREDQRMMWCISVADNGPGVDDELKTVIFDRFTQASGVARGSSGLGLHIAKSLVISYKGRIWVEDRVPGDRSKGSVFKVLLPKAADAI